MSSWRTHALVGGVVGFGIVRFNHGDAHEPHSWMIIASSSFLAILPDVDHPKSWISKHVTTFMTLGFWLGLCTLLSIHYASSINVYDQSGWIRAIGGVIVCGICARVMTLVILALIRRASGRHRGITHSWLVAMLTGFAAWHFQNQSAFAWTLAAISYSIIIHTLADIVTPSGVAIFYPVTSWKLRILPEPIARFGELIIASITISSALWLLMGM